MQRSTSSRLAVSVLAVFSLLCSTLLIKGIISQVPTGAWAPAGTMASPPSGAATVALQDGRPLITGGGAGTGSRPHRGWLLLRLGPNMSIRNGAAGIFRHLRPLDRISFRRTRAHYASARALCHDAARW